MPTVQGYDFLKSSLCPSPPCARQSLETNANTFVVYNPQLFTLRWCMLLQRLMKIAVEAKMCPNCFLNFRTRFNLLMARVEFMSNYAQVFFCSDRTAFYIYIAKRDVGGPKAWTILKLYWSIALLHLMRLSWCPNRQLKLGHQVLSTLGSGAACADCAMSNESMIIGGSTDLIYSGCWLDPHMVATPWHRPPSHNLLFKFKFMHQGGFQVDADWTSTKNLCKLCNTAQTVAYMPIYIVLWLECSKIQRIIGFRFRSFML